MGDETEIRRWLEWRFREHEAQIVGTTPGTYGRVWFLERPSHYPRRVAYKGDDPVRAAMDGDARDLFEREIGLWLRLPHHRCVLPVLSLELAPADGRLAVAQAQEPTVPLVGMPHMQGSLTEWIGSEMYTEPDRIWALAQFCAGLRWLYRNGFEGHGDLKPANILYRDLHDNLRAEDRSKLPRWEIRVADFGWADIWLHRQGPEYATKAWRPYLAPERLDGEVIAEASDIFAVGVIAVELLTGVHPAGEETPRVAKWRPQRYSAWANKGQRLVSAVPASLREVLSGCLEPQPGNRPSAGELERPLCRVLRASGDVPNAAEILARWDQWAAPTADDLRTRRWNEEQLARLSPTARDELIESLSHEVAAAPLPGSRPALARWLTAAKSLCYMLCYRADDRDVARAADVALVLLRTVVRNFGTDLRRQLDWDDRFDRPVIHDLEPHEVMLEFVQAALLALNEAGRSMDDAVVELNDEIHARLNKPNLLDAFISRLTQGSVSRNEDL